MVSIIVPVYNAQRTLDRCLKSIKDQTYQNVEIVVVNDGSTDHSQALIDISLNNISNKIIVQKARNEGLEKARRTGLKACHGDYIAFVDADDYIEKDAIEMMMNAMRKYDADLIQCRTSVFVTMANKLKIHLPKRINNRTIRLIEKDEIMKKEYLSFFGCGSFNVSVWAKLYKKETLLHVRCGNLFFGEDLYLNMQVFPRLNRICVIPNILYHYERQGLTSKFMPRFMDDTKMLYCLKVEKAKELQSEKAILYSTIELRNCLKTFIKSMILHNVDTQENIKKWIAEELSDNTYDVFEWLKQQDQCGRSLMSVAIMDKDVDTIYDLARKSVYEWNWKKIARRILVHLN